MKNAGNAVTIASVKHLCAVDGLIQEIKVCRVGDVYCPREP